MPTTVDRAPSVNPVRVAPITAHRRGRSLLYPRRLWLFALPAALVYAYIVLLPTGQGVFYSLTNWDGISSYDFVGFENFTKVFEDPASRTAITNTAVYATISTVFENVIGLLLALALNSKIKSRHALRVVFFMPVVILSIIVAYLWKYMFSPGGVATSALQLVGFRDAHPLWLNDPDLVVYSICIIMIWQFSGYTMVIYLAGLEGVAREQIEAAQVDGAGPFARFWYVVRPALAPAITVNVLLCLIRGLMIFDQVWATTGGGPYDSSQSLSTIVYRTAFQYGELAQGLALAIILGLGVAAVGLVQYRLQLRTGGNR